MAQCFWYNRKFCKTRSRQWPDGDAKNQFPFQQKRFVYAAGGPAGGSGGAEGGPLNPDEMTAATLKDDLEALKGTLIPAELVERAQNILASASTAIQALLLHATKKMVQGHYTADGYKAELEYIAASAAGGAPQAPATPNAPQSPETPNAPTPPKSPETAAAAGAAAAAAKPAATPIDDIRSKMADQLAQAQGSIAGLIKTTQRKKPTGEELTNTLNEIKQGMDELVTLEEKTRDEEKNALKQLIKLGRLTNEDAQDILNLSVEDSKFDSKWHEIMEDLLQDARHRNTVQLILNIKKRNNNLYKKIEEDFGKKMNQLREALGQAGAEIIEKAEQERNIREYGKSIGFNLEKGKVLRFKDMRILRDKDGNILLNEGGEIAGYEPIYRRAKIKKVFFHKEHGVPSTVPSLELEVDDEWADKNGNITQKETVVIDAISLKKFADSKEMVEYIDDRQETDETDKELEQLVSLLGEDISVGDMFEYREATLDDNGSPAGKNKKVIIQSIEKVSQESDPKNFFNHAESQKKDLKSTVIKLDNKVVVSTEGGIVEKDTLTLGEFAKWYRRMDAIKPLNLEELRAKLDEHAKELSKKYNRSLKQYPPIKLEPEEMLYCDTEPPRNFKIKDVTEDKITLDNGTEFTPATFLSWVKNSQVEKRDPAAEAHKLTDRIKDEKKRAEELEAEKKRQEEKLKAESALRDKGKDEEGRTLVKDNPDAPNVPDKSYLRNLWNNTYFMSLGDLYAMGAEIGEFIKRTLERRQKGRVGAVGNAALAPIYAQLGAEFRTMEQGSENDRVNFFSEAYKQFGPGDLFDRLVVTSNRDELKALFINLSEKGAIRWDDPRVHDAINRVARWYDAPCFVNGYDTDAIQQVLDSWWGQQSFNSYRSQNNSAFGQTKTSYLDEAKRLENDPEKKGGMRGQLQMMLHKHIHGTGYVDPAVYEAYLHYAIMAGKLSFSDKMYFTFMALGTVGHPNSGYPGQSLLNFGRISNLEGELLNNFPILDYFTTSRLPMVDKNGKPIIDPETGLQKRDQMDENFVRNIVRKYIGSEDQLKATEAVNFSPGKDFMTYVEREVILDKTVISRLEKAAGDSKRWDHDDFHMFAPHLPDSVVDSLTLGIGPGAQSTPEGKRNALVGFNNYTKIFVEEIEANLVDDPDKAQDSLFRMMKTFSSFVKFTAILEDRYYHGTHDRARLYGPALKSFAVVDSSRIVKEHVDELNMFIGTLTTGLKKALDAKGVSPNPFETVDSNWHNIIRVQPKEGDRDFMNLQTGAIKNFYENFEKAMNMAKSELGLAGVAKILIQTQKGGPGGRNLCQGILAAPKTKEEMQKMEERNKEALYGTEGAGEQVSASAPAKDDDLI